MGLGLCGVTHDQTLVMQLVAYGAQDIYLTGNPSITFFKLVYRRYTSFALESIEQTFNGTVGWGRRVSATVSRNGDLVTTCYLEIVLKRKVTNGQAYYPAEALIKEVQFELGGQKVDSMTSTFHRVYDEVFRTNAEKEGYKRLTNFADNSLDGVTERFYLPLIFFFNRNPGLALPLIALQYHEAKFHVQFETAEVMAKLGVDTTVDPLCTLYVTFVFLDVEERRRYASTSHEFLITQCQYTGSESVAPDAISKKTQNVRLNFNHPSKYLLWVIRDPTLHGKFTCGALGETSDSYAPLLDARLTLNGHDRFSTRKGSYFNQVQPFESAKSAPAAGIYLYSLALDLTSTQPSGSVNFSRIDQSTLILTLKAGNQNAIANVKSEEDTLAAVTSLTSLEIFAENYNILRVLSGMGGLAYSN